MDIQNRQTSNTFPKMVAKRHNRTTIYYVPYNISENGETYEFSYVSLLPEYYDYGGLIDAIISVKYSIKDSIAIINNYLVDSENEKYKKEFLEFQEWRNFAKAESKKYFNL